MTTQYVININPQEFDRNHDEHTNYTYDTFTQNLERILLACKLKDYSAVVDGTRYILNVDPNITFWRTDKERRFSSYFLSFRSFYHVYGGIDVRIAIRNNMSNINKQDVWNMAWIVEYFIINGCNMRRVSIDEIYKVWGTNLPKLFGDVDEEQLSTIRKMYVVASSTTTGLKTQ